MEIQEPTFHLPQKEIHTKSDFVKWQSSKAKQLLLSFVSQMAESVKGKKNTTECPKTEIISNLVSVIETIEIWFEEIPPVDHTGRFGNPSYRTWFKKVEQV
jgi:serine/threonine-protein phosphatase 2A activator